MGGFRRFIQIMIALIAIVTLVASISLFYPIPYLSTFMESNIINHFWPSVIVSSILLLIALLCLVVFLYACFAPAKLDELIIKTDFGELSIGHEAVEATAVRAIRHLPAVKNINAKAFFIKDPSNTRVRIKFDIDEAEDIIEIGKDIQTRVQIAVETTLGVTVKKIDVDVNQLKADEPKSKQTQATNIPRVQ